MNKVKILSISVVALILLNLCVLIYITQKPTQPPPFENGPPKDENNPALIIIKKLQFNDEQIDQFNALKNQHHSQINQYNADIKLTKTLLYQSVSNDTGKNYSDSIIERLGSLQKDIERTHYQHFQSIKAMCTPAQQERFKDLMEEIGGFFNSPNNQRQPPPLLPPFENR
jgi:Spy/CpxP family protein refolding chaperone